MTVARIFKFPKPGASTEMKVPSEVPVANPLGSWLTVFMYSKYSSAVGNSGSVSGVSADAVAIVLVAEADLVTDGDEEAVKADDRVATITESTNKKVEVENIIVGIISHNCCFC